MTNRSAPDLYIGLKMFGHDSAVFAISPESKELFGIASERLTRYKHDNVFPVLAVERFISYSRIDPASVKRLHVGSCFTEHAKYQLPESIYANTMAERAFLKATYSSDYRAKFKEFMELPRFVRLLRQLGSVDGWKMLAVPRLQRSTHTVEELLRRRLQKLFRNAEILISHYDHERCHAASSYYFSPHARALLVAFDGLGDDDVFSRIFLARDGSLEEVCRSTSPHALFRPEGPNTVFEPVSHLSVGAIYSCVTRYLGFEPISDEGKVEALAAFGKWDNRFYAALMDLTTVNETNGVGLDLDKAHALLSRAALDSLGLVREDIAAAVQRYTEDVLIRHLRPFVEKHEVGHICLSGGVTANVIVNLRILNELNCAIHVVPAMADDGAAQGAAVLRMFDSGFSHADLQWLREKEMPYFGTSYSRGEARRRIEAFIARSDVSLEVHDLGDAWPEAVAELVGNGQVGALFHGRMEWGPRALGNRSLLANPQMPNIREVLNRDIKRRPLFQPFCPSILVEERERLFERSYVNKHMTVAFLMRKEFWSVLPGAVHVDGTARVQFVSEQDNPMFYRLLRRMREITGFGVVINTSFNKHGRTIVETPEDALTDYIDTSMDFLLVEGFLVRRAAVGSPLPDQSHYKGAAVTAASG